MYYDNQHFRGVVPEESKFEGLPEKVKAWASLWTVIAVRMGRVRPEEEIREAEAMGEAQARAGNEPGPIGWPLA